jgi:hypothetical protein
MRCGIFSCGDKFRWDNSLIMPSMPRPGYCRIWYICLSGEKADRRDRAPPSSRPCILIIPDILFDADARSMTSNRLGRRRSAEHEVSDKRADRDGKHDPTVVCHEQQPAAVSSQSQMFRFEKHLHDEERVKHLHSIQQALDNLDLLLRVLSSVSSWGE